MKIGLLTYSLIFLGRYWEKLKDKADCWWGVPERKLYDLLVEKNIKNIVYHHEEHVIDPSVSSGNKFVPVEPGKAQRIIAEKMNPDIWIADTLNKLNYVPKKAIWVQAFHSLPIKKHFFYKPLLDYDLMLLPGEYHKEELIKRLQLKENDERLKVVGWPRVDDLVNGVYDREVIMQDLGLDVNKKTVMYAPTWGWGYGNNSFFARWFGREAEVFEQLCRETADLNLNFIVRLHPLSCNVDNETLLEISRKYNVLWQITEVSNFNHDPNQYLWITDILISDLSGVIADFMVLDRPVIYIDPDESIEPWDDSDMPKSFRSGHVVKTPEELLIAIKDSVLYPERYSRERKEVLSRLYYNLDGKATDRAVEAIMDFAASKGLK